MRYLLLPFTHGIDGQAITYALSLASQREAALILLSLLRPSRRRGKQAVRLEDIQQVTDFVEYTQRRATRMGIPIQHAEIHTEHPVQSIRAFALEMDCEGIILFVRRGKGILLDTYEIKQLLEDQRIPLYVANLPQPRFSLPQWWP
jgi:hypothetical protein